MKRCFDDDSPTSNQQSTKYSKNQNNTRKLTFQFKNDSAKDSDLPSSTLQYKPSYQLTPYPKLTRKQLQQYENEDNELVQSNSNNRLEIGERRNPEFLAKLGSLNRSFIRWIDIYFNKGDHYDFTPVCNDYVRFMNNLQEKYPIENNLNSNEKSLATTATTATNSLTEESPSPIKNKLNFQLMQQFNTNTPPPNPGDKDYKSTPYPKHLLAKQQAAASESVNKFKFGSDDKYETTRVKEESLQSQEQQHQQQTNPIKFNLLPQQTVTTAINENKKEFKFSSFQSDISPLVSNSMNEFTFNNQLGTANSISKNLFDVKPKLTNSNSLSTPSKDGQMKQIDSNFFSSENIFKTQLNQSTTDHQQSNTTVNQNLNLTINTATANETLNDDDENYVPPRPEAAIVEEDASFSVKYVILNCQLIFIS